MIEYSEIGRKPKIGDILQFKEDKVFVDHTDKDGKWLKEPHIYKNLYNDTEDQLRYHQLCIVTQVSGDTVSIKRINKVDSEVAWFEMNEFYYIIDIEKIWEICTHKSLC